MAFLTKSGRTYSPPASEYNKVVYQKPPSWASSPPKQSTNPIISAFNAVKNKIVSSTQTAGTDIKNGASYVATGAEDIGTKFVSSTQTTYKDLGTAKNDIINGAKIVSNTLGGIGNTLGGIGNFLKSYWYIILAIIVGIILLIVFVFAKSGGSIIGGVSA